MPGGDQIPWTWMATPSSLSSLPGLTGGAAVPTWGWPTDPTLATTPLWAPGFGATSAWNPLLGAGISYPVSTLNQQLNQTLFPPTLSATGYADQQAALALQNMWLTQAAYQAGTLTQPLPVANLPVSNFAPPEVLPVPALPPTMPTDPGGGAGLLPTPPIPPPPQPSPPMPDAAASNFADVDSVLRSLGQDLGMLPEMDAFIRDMELLSSPEGLAMLSAIAPSMALPAAIPAPPGAGVSNLPAATTQQVGTTGAPSGPVPAYSGAVPRLAGGEGPNRDKYEPYAWEMARKYNVDGQVLANMITKESKWDPKAYNDGSGATGIAQFMPNTWPDFGIDPWDPYQSIEAAAKYLRQILDQHNGNYALAVAGYNAGPNRQELKEGRIPDNPETRDYVQKILGIDPDSVG